MELSSKELKKQKRKQRINEFNNHPDKVIKYISDTIVKDNVDYNERSIISYISTASIDRHNEIVIPAGIDITNYRNNPVVCVNHDIDEIPSAKNAWIKLDSKGLLAKTIFRDNDEGNNLFDAYTTGYMNAFSIGFIPLEVSYDSENRKVYNKSELYEYSCVTVPANADALQCMLKSFTSPKLIKSLNQYKEEFEMENNLKELFDTKKQFEDHLIKYAELEAKIKSLDDVQNKLQEIEKQKNEQDIVIVKLQNDLQKMLKKDLDVKKLKSFIAEETKNETLRQLGIGF